MSLTRGFYGTYDLDANLSKGVGKNSYFSVSWQKNMSTGNATKGFNGGYHCNGRGIMRKLPESPDFKVKLTLDVKRGGGPNSQFYLLDIGSCWKNNGDSCDGDVLTDVTRYSEMIINPATTSWCRPDNLVSCPPYHVSPTGGGWVGDSRAWELDVGTLSSRLHFYQDPGTKPARRVWSSINVGTEIHVSSAGEIAE
ncbi:hypothetical protein L1049_008539 [Liquidambar formosana]|uniref:DUF7705 domain-containing protein n=1 Tax=Liquidambar formosana TaxID=63359 RepID=A0AAP0S3S5_LIQFO